MSVGLPRLLLVAQFFALNLVSTAFAGGVNGVDFQNFHEVEVNIYRSARPDYGDLQEMRQRLGLKTVIDLEAHADKISAEYQMAKGLGIQFFSSPMVTTGSPNDSEVNNILRTLSNSSYQPILIHCAHGEDRTGLIIGLFRVFHDHWSPVDAYNEMLKYGFHSDLGDLTSYFKWKTHFNGNL